MANIRDLRQRITSVGNIQKITRAMEMVATTKLRRFQERAVAAGPYARDLTALVRHLVPAARENLAELGTAAALFEPGPADKPHGIAFVGSDRGLCGAYNANIQRHLDAEMEARGRKARLFVFGRKAMTHATRMGYEIEAYFDEHPLEKLCYGSAAEISRQLVQAFRSGGIADMSLCYTEFRSMARFEPRFVQLLPVSPPAAPTAEDLAEERDLAGALLEPDAGALVGRLIPRYLEMGVYYALLTSITSEYASRRAAMKNATDAAGDMKRDITREYNKVRQQRITSEILEVVAGAEAL